MSYLQCLWYLLVHKYYVWIFGQALRVTPWRLLIHDWTKLLPIQLNGYVDYHKNNAIVTESTYRAIHDHFRRESHHWNHHVVMLDNGDLSKEYSVVCLPMKDQDIREMVADWAAAGLTKKGRYDLPGYYAKKKHAILLHAETREKVERYIDLLTYDRKLHRKISAAS
jgi:hypothetical protein